MTKAKILEGAEELILEAEEMRDRLERSDPARVPTAQKVIQDAIMAYVLMQQSKRLTPKIRGQVAALYQRALTMSESLRAPLQ